MTTIRKLESKEDKGTPSFSCHLPAAVSGDSFKPLEYLSVIKVLVSLHHEMEVTSLGKAPRPTTSSLNKFTAASPQLLHPFFFPFPPFRPACSFLLTPDLCSAAVSFSTLPQLPGGVTSFPVFTILPILLS